MTRRLLAALMAPALVLGLLTAGVLVAPASADSATPAGVTTGPHASPAATTSVQHRKGRLTRKERRDRARLRVSDGRVRTVVRFGRRCQALRVVLRDGTGRVASRKGRSPLVLRAKVQAGPLRVVLRKRHRETRCRAGWRVRSRIKSQDAGQDKSNGEPQPSETATPEPAPQQGITPLAFGAVGDGVTDDSAALDAAVASLSPGDALTIPAGQTFRHTDIWRIDVPGVTINGSGTLLATNQERSAVHLAADGITLDGPTLRAAEVTERWVAFEQMKLRLGPHDGLVVRNVVVDGAAAAGIYVGGATNFEITGVQVRRTRADGIHITTGAHDGIVQDAQVIEPGDDGIAIVSYLNDGQRVRRVTVASSHVRDQLWGRGFAVVGGADITLRDIVAERSAGAGIYVAAEEGWNTFGVQDVSIERAELLQCNQQAAEDAQERPSPNKGRVVHGAVHVSNFQPGQTVSDVSMTDVTIRDTDPDGYNHVRLLTDELPGTVTRLHLARFTISGGSQYHLAAFDVPDAAYRTINWTMDGSALADHAGW